MTELSTLMENVARLLAVIGGGISAIAFCYAGILWMTASGDPQKMGQARTAIFGAVGGLVIVGVAFMAPRIISEFVIEPAGGQVMAGDQGVSCDNLLRSQLQVQRGASTAARMNQVISQIQAQREECPEDTWDPVVVDLTTGPPDYTTAHADKCWNTASAATTGVVGTGAAGAAGAVGDTRVPSSLRHGNDDGGLVRALSGRDSENNIIIYWERDRASRPTDAAKCWLYVSRLRTWDENY